jgi:deoxyribose-phosphate aldolase
MDRPALAACIDHTVLGPLTSTADVRAAAETAATAGMHLCVPPRTLAAVAASFPGELGTVIGFPHGTDTPATKAAAAAEAVAMGADVLDLVPDLGAAVAGDADRLRADIAAVTDAVAVPVRVIAETALVPPAAVERVATAAVAAGAAGLKTSTGYGGEGATVPAVRQLAAHLPVKASGGIRTYDDALRMLEAGAVRLGTSAGPAVLAAAPE